MSIGDQYEVFYADAELVARWNRVTLDVYQRARGEVYTAGYYWLEVDEQGGQVSDLPQGPFHYREAAEGDAIEKLGLEPEEDDDE